MKGNGQLFPATKVKQSNSEWKRHSLLRERTTNANGRDDDDAARSCLLVMRTATAGAAAWLLYDRCVPCNSFVWKQDDHHYENVSSCSPFLDIQAALNGGFYPPEHYVCTDTHRTAVCSP
jgi:hypothetical protein